MSQLSGLFNKRDELCRWLHFNRTKGVNDKVHPLQFNNECYLGPLLVPLFLKISFLINE
jgi:hypothetical protein